MQHEFNLFNCTMYLQKKKKPNKQRNIFINVFFFIYDSNLVKGFLIKHEKKTV